MAEPGIFNRHVGRVEGKRTGRFLRDRDTTLGCMNLKNVCHQDLSLRAHANIPRRRCYDERHRRPGSNSSRVPPAIHDSRHQGGATNFKIA